MRAAFRSVVFVSLVAGFCIYNNYSENTEILPEVGRRLQETEGADPTWTIAFYIIGILYLFLALAIVCDEYFVPALEEMSGENQLNLSLDVAGATLMAAGGSAPELFTSLFGTFAESSVGFGTIVGSAVFNVLFVIGMCSLLSTETLQLTWWPLFRDSSYYAVSLLVLAIFVGVVSEETIEFFEAMILFAMYLGYVGVMYFNEKLYHMLTGKQLYPTADDVESPVTEEVSHAHNVLKFPGAFRAGLLTLLRNPDNWFDKASVGLVAKIAGNVDEVFSHVDQDGDGVISNEELRRCLNRLEDQPVTDAGLQEVMRDLDPNGDGEISKAEFKKWYITSEDHVKTQIKKVFDQYDSDNSGSITKPEFERMVKKIEPAITHVDNEKAQTECFGGSEAVSFEEFSTWYLDTSWLHDQQEKAKEMNEEDDRTLLEIVSLPKNAGTFGIIKHLILFPLIFSLAFTIPDVRRKSIPGKFCYVAFFLAIAWIGFYSYFMVGWAEIVGATVGIPPFIMGLTFLAAGTSVPDLLSSVIVARMGEGDMAVSSSIGSNIFDILVGLPLPWLIFILYPNDKNTVTITAGNIWLSILILLAMLVLIIGSIHCQGWRLTKPLGYMMFFFYFLFLLQAILMEYVF